MTWPNEGGYLNYILYRMCKEQPHHRDLSVVSGKIGLIGRAYAAAPGRGVDIDDFDQKLAVAVVERGQELDDTIDKARGLPRISVDTIGVAVAAHNLLNDIITGFIRRAVGDNAERRTGHRNSFCSKYLHFHAPMAFPILDSRVSKSLQDARKSGSYVVPKCGKGPTGTYATFCRKLVAYAGAHHEPDQWTPRTVDGDLWPYPILDTRLGTNK